MTHRDDFTVEREHLSVRIPEHLVVLSFNDDESALAFQEWLADNRAAFLAWCGPEDEET